MKMAAFLPPLPLYFITPFLFSDSPLHRRLPSPTNSTTFSCPLSASRNRILSVSHGPAGVPEAFRPNVEEAQLGGRLATGHCQQESRA